MTAALIIVVCKRRSHSNKTNWSLSKGHLLFILLFLFTFYLISWTTTSLTVYSTGWADSSQYILCVLTILTVLVSLLMIPCIVCYQKIQENIFSLSNEKETVSFHNAEPVYQTINDNNVGAYHIQVRNPAMIINEPLPNDSDNEEDNVDINNVQLENWYVDDVLSPPHIAATPSNTSLAGTPPHTDVIYSNDDIDDLAIERLYAQTNGCHQPNEYAELRLPMAAVEPVEDTQWYISNDYQEISEYEMRLSGPNVPSDYIPMSTNVPSDYIPMSTNVPSDYIPMSTNVYSPPHNIKYDIL